MISKDSIVIGQYYPGFGFLYTIDPRAKIISFLFLMIMIFVYKTITSFIPIFILIMSFFILSRIPLKHVLKGLKPIFILLIITIFFHFFFTPGKSLLNLFFLKLTYEGLTRGIFIGTRLILLIFISSILTFTTSPLELTRGLEFLTLPLNKIGFPSSEIIMMITIALRFIPVLVEEADRIIVAQISRGANLYEGNIIKRSKNLIPILIPLFISAFRRAEDLAIAMEVRCFQPGKKRTYMRRLIWHKSDTIFLILILFLGVLSYFIK
ncbi:MAG: energy-coupling factor transporter transmembrane component T [Caldisericia bacterium]|jgi:energy-coupling factor transport system permease protein|nr:energy-coupling factor transporter transmembrane component T [Caldisericia bacterium]